MDPVELQLSFPDVFLEAIPVVDLGKSRDVVGDRARIDAIAAAVLQQQPRGGGIEWRAPEQFGIAKPLLVPGARVERKGSLRASASIGQEGISRRDHYNVSLA